MFLATFLGRLHSVSERTTLFLAAALAFFVASARGDFFVSNGNQNSPQGNNVLRFDDAGNFIGVFVTSGSGDLRGPRGLAFGPDGNLYLSSNANDSVLRYDGTTGAFIDSFVPAGSGGLQAPQALIFRDDGFIYVKQFWHGPGPGPLPRWKGNSVRRQQRGI
jgi:hypothetical protein